MRNDLFGTWFALALVAGSVFAVPPSVAAESGDVTAAKLSPAEIVRTVEAAGYTNVNDLEFDDGRWEFEATSAAGARVELQVDGATGKILHEEAD